MKMKKCLNVIVFYNNYDEVCRYINSVNEIAQDVVDILVVVNSDINHDVNNLKKKVDTLTNVMIIDYHKNIGYLNAFLDTIKTIDIEEYKYFILSNTDIEYQQKNFFQLLFKKEFLPNIGCIAPSIYVPSSNSYSNPHYIDRVSKNHYKKLLILFSRPLLARGYLKLATIKSRWRKSVKQPSRYVYAPHGAFMIFSKKFVNQISGSRYGTLMYSEEAYIGELLLKNDMECYYWKEIEVVHLCSTVTGKINYKKRFGMWKESIEYILTQFYDN